jgi:hypothetical protein
VAGVIRFDGPIFVVGIPRSGTALLREMLNNHPEIGIPDVESACLPYFYRRFERFGDLRQPGNFHLFYREFSKTQFFTRLTDTASFIDEESWISLVRRSGDYWSFAAVIQCIYVEYAARKGKRIWGDKTPQYIFETQLLKSIFPTAKFVHIVRDPRDNAISNRVAWRKNLFRSVQYWRDGVSAISSSAKDLDKDYFCVRYEDVLMDPQKCASALCDFLGVTYRDSMVELRRPTDFIGGAKGHVGIKRDNAGKWKTELDQQTVRRMDQICGPLLIEYGFPSTYCGKAMNIGRGRFLLYRFLDAVNLVLVFGRRGPVLGFQRLIRAIRRKRQTFTL